MNPIHSFIHLSPTLTILATGRQRPLYPTSNSILTYSLFVAALAVNSKDRHTAGNLLPEVLAVCISDI